MSPDNDAAQEVDRLGLKTMSLGSPKAQRNLLLCAGSLATLAQMKSYHGFPERLHHRVPHWVEPGALFHIRIRFDREKQQRTLVDPPLAQALLIQESSMKGPCDGISHFSC